MLSPVTVGCAIAATVSFPWAATGFTFTSGISKHADGIPLDLASKHGTIDDQTVEWLSSMSFQDQQQFLRAIGDSQMVLHHDGNFMGELDGSNLRAFFSLSPQKKQRAFGYMANWDWQIGKSSAASTESTSTSSSLETVGNSESSTFDAPLPHSEADQPMTRPSDVDTKDDQNRPVETGASVTGSSPGALAGTSGSDSSSSASANLVQVPELEDEWLQAFADAQATKTNGRMGAFIRQLIKHHGGRWTSDGSIAGLAPYYSGKAASMSYHDLLAELRRADWIQNFA